MSPKVVRGGCKGLFDSFGPREQRSPKSLLHHQTLFCTGATPFRTSARGLLLAGSKRPFAASANHFRELSLFGQFPRSTASQSLCSHWSGNLKFRTPQTTGIFSKASPVQMGDVLRHKKLEAYRSTDWRCTAAFPFLQI